MSRRKWVGLLCLLMAFYGHPLFAAGWDVAANNALHFLTNFSGLLVALSYLTATGFTISAVLKYKQHRESPQFIPISRPIGDTIMAVALFVLPTLVTFSGSPFFGEKASDESTIARYHDGSQDKPHPAPAQDSAPTDTTYQDYPY